MKKSGKARAHTNIALIKYWGKADEDLIIPMNNSLSVTLERFYTETRVTFDASLTEDQLILNKEAVNAKESAKIQRYMDMIRKEAGISTYALIESDNFVPTAAGLASSASAYAALAGACNEALDLNLSDKDLSRLARRGSGSASRSIYGGFAEWEKGHDDKTSYAHQIESDGFENDLAMIFVVINNKLKKVSSRSGMSLTKQAIAQKDFKRMGEVIEANGLRMHATNLGAQPPFTYLVPESYEAMRIVHECREAGLPCYFTMDAGPNVKVLIEKKHQQAIVNQFLEVFNKDQIITSDITHAGVEIIK